MIVQPILPMSGYPGYTSLLNGKDFKAIEILLSLHSPISDPLILDCTFGRGTMWGNCSYQPNVRTDILPEGVDTGADFMAMPFQDESFDVVVFDPPHIGRYRGPRCSRFHADRYGIDRGPSQEDSISPIFRPFLLEAKRVLRRNGIVMAKLIDHVARHGYQWEQVAFIQACREAGLTPCDMLIKKSPAAQLVSSKWKNQMHTRRGHCYWIVIRKGGCERPC